MLHPAQVPIAQLLEDCKIQRTRGSGPGGQHRNKVETAIVVEHLPTGLRGMASERRSQDQNRKQAIFRLRVKLAIEFRQEPAAQPSELWQQRTSNKRISVNPLHEDFPALLAESLDVIHAQDYAMPQAAAVLGISSSQLIKFIGLEPAALVSVNRVRKSLGQSPLR